MSARLVALLAAAALVLPGCAAVRADQTAASPLVVVLFDVSASTDEPAIRARYQEAFGRVLDAVAAEHGTVVGDVIDHNPLAHASYPIAVTFEGCDPLNENQLVCEGRDRQARDGALAAAEGILAREPVRNGTDIHDGVRLAERVFASYPEATSRSLVLLSDMVEFTPGLRLGGASFDPASALDAITAADDVPDLAGVAVYVVGAGVVAKRELTPETILAIESFWQGFFAAAGADLPDERYGAALLRFP